MDIPAITVNAVRDTPPIRDFIGAITSLLHLRNGKMPCGLASHYALARSITYAAPYAAAQKAPMRAALPRSP